MSYQLSPSVGSVCRVDGTLQLSLSNPQSVRLSLFDEVALFAVPKVGWVSKPKKFKKSFPSLRYVPSRTRFSVSTYIPLRLRSDNSILFLVLNDSKTFSAYLSVIYEFQTPTLSSPRTTGTTLDSSLTL